MLASNTSRLPALHVAFAKWDRQGRRGNGTETHPLHLRGLGCGAPGRRSQRVCWFRICKALCYGHIWNKGKPVYRLNYKPWETRSERFAGFLQHPGPEGFTFLVPVRALVACLHFISSCFSISYPLCFCRPLCCIHTPFNLTVLIFHLVALAPYHIPPDEAHEPGMCHCLLNCSPPSPWQWGGFKGGARGAGPGYFALSLLLPLLSISSPSPALPQANTHGNGLGVRSGRRSVVTQPLLPCAELTIKPIQAMAGDCSYKTGIRGKIQHVLFDC